jgi:hypothetical protein
MKCAYCHEGDNEKGRVFIYPTGNFHEVCFGKKRGEG